jgi:hypothetical protein
MRRKPDAPPLNLVAPPVMDLREQIIAEQKRRGIEAEAQARSLVSA